ncbi:MAG: Gfo/Idh/MocA family oxidoreductase, partial [Bryobacteraceae bacterium]|nr:Gfo/Idh/MocA family oxidoreductase [Bryobacteraceae bacterium]
MLESKSTRRQFLTTSAALTTAAASAQTGRILGANDRINVGVIGVGIRGMGHVRTIMQRAEMKGDVRLAAISDIYSRRTEAARQAARLDAKDVHRDYRELLARADVDAVFIVTPDHWHAKMAIEAMERGKDVYLEKPMTLTIEEARQIAEKVKQTGRVLQVGSQHLSDKRYHKAREVVEKGWIGEVLWAQT